LIVTNSLTGGGAERSMNLVANQLSRQGWQVGLVPVNASVEDYIKPICEVFSLHRVWRGGPITTILAIVKFNVLVHKLDPKIIVLNCELPELLGAFLFMRRKLIGVEHVNHPWINRRLLGRFIRRILDLRGIQWAAVSKHLSIWPSFKEPRYVLPNAIESEPAASTNFQEKNKEAPINQLVFVGRLTDQKQPHLFLEIGERAGVSMKIIGDGLLRAELEAKALQGLVSFEFLGHRLDPWAELNSGDLLLVTSAYEGDGLVVIEALLRGIPMLLTDIPDFRRFEFPDENYCGTVEEFCTQIEKYKYNLNRLAIPAQTAQGIIRSRSITFVGQTWQKVLTEI
jgi:glycosyltransferase involved in cell wall biosynthesis